MWRELVDLSRPRRLSVFSKVDCSRRAEDQGLRGSVVPPDECVIHGPGKQLTNRAPMFWTPLLIPSNWVWN